MTASEVEKFRYLILAVQRQGNRMLNELLTNTGVTSSQAEAIRMLEFRQPLSLKELGKLLICESGSPSRLVDRMVKDGYIQRTIHSDDSRYVLLQLTCKGRQTAEKIKDVEVQMYKALEQIITEDEMKIVNDILQKMLNELPVRETLMKRGYLPE